MELPFVTEESQSLLWWDTSPAYQASHQWKACPEGWLWLWLVLCDEDGLSSVAAAESDPGHGFQQHLQANTGCQSPPWAGLGISIRFVLESVCSTVLSTHSLIPSCPLVVPVWCSNKKLPFFPPMQKVPVQWLATVWTEELGSSRVGSSFTQLIGRLPGWFDGLAMKLRFKGNWGCPNVPYVKKTLCCLAVKQTNKTLLSCGYFIPRFP